MTECRKYSRLVYIYMTNVLLILVLSDPTSSLPTVSLLLNIIFKMAYQSTDPLR